MKTTIKNESSQKLKSREEFLKKNEYRINHYLDYKETWLDKEWAIKISSFLWHLIHNKIYVGFMKNKISKNIKTLYGWIKK